jgi:hypothetical protein
MTPDELDELFDKFDKMDKSKQDDLVLFAVYYHPKDYPDHIVVRRWVGLKPDLNALLYKDLEGAREDLKKRGLERMNRMPGDDHTLVET